MPTSDFTTLIRVSFAVKKELEKRGMFNDSMDSILRRVLRMPKL